MEFRNKFTNMSASLIMIQRGFTLLESMVCIAVIGVMITIFQPFIYIMMAEARLIQLTAIQTQIRTAMEAGKGDLEERGAAGLMDTLGLGWGTTVYAYINQQGTSNDQVIDALVPGLNRGWFKSRHQHAYIIWDTQCYMETVAGASCMSWASLAIDCKYKLVDGWINWHDDQAWGIPGGETDAVLRYRFPFGDAASMATFGCGSDGMMDGALIANTYDITEADAKDTGAGAITDVKEVDVEGGVEGEGK